MPTGAFAAARASKLDFQPMMYMTEYLDELAGQGKSASYVTGMRNGLHHFGEFLRTEGVKHPEEITRLHIIRFQGDCNSKVTSGTWTKSNSIQVLKKARAWLNWAEPLGYIGENPWHNIKVGTVKKEPNPISDEDMDSLWREHNRHAFSMSPFTFHRREMMLTLLYAWGLRIHELEALTITNMDMRLDFVIARNKGGGTKTLPYTPEIKKTFARWSRVRAEYARPGVDSLLITTGGSLLSKEQVRTIVTDLGTAAGIKINPHMLRDTCGTHLLDDDQPVERVMAILGHTNMAQTLGYARVNNKKVYETVEIAMDPRLRMFQNTRDLR